MPIPVQANFRPAGMYPNVVGGQRGSLTSVGFYNDTRTSGIAPGSGNVYVARAVAYDATGDFDLSNPTREPRLGVAAVTGAFAAADFAGFALRQNADPVRGTIADAQTINDTTETFYLPGQVISRAVADEWWVEYNTGDPVPARGDAVFIQTAATLEGVASAATGVALPTDVAVFVGRVEQGWDGKSYALVNIKDKLA